MVKRRKRLRDGTGDPEGPLTEAEWAIIRVVWEHEPCAAGTVQEELEKTKGWAYSTVKTTMNRMAAKGLLATEKIRNLHLFTARVSEKEAQRGEFRKMLGRAFEGAMTPMMHFLLENEHFSEDELNQLRKSISEAKRRKGRTSRR